MLRQFALLDADTVLVAPVRVAIVAAETAEAARALFPERRVIAFPIPGPAGTVEPTPRIEWRALPVLSDGQISRQGAARALRSDATL